MAGNVEQLPDGMRSVRKDAPRGRYLNDTEAQIDDILVGLGHLLRRHLNTLLVFALIAGLIYAFALPLVTAVIGVALGFARLFLLIVFSAAGILVQFGVLFWFLGRGRTYWVQPGESGVTFDDYRGNPEVLESASRVVTLLRGVKSFRDMGGEHIRGLLLIGPPGTGKSYLAQAISTEAGVPFGYASAPSFQNMFLGISSLRVMMLYRKARKLAKKYGACILFIDEVDAIAQTRQGTQGGGMGGLFGGGSSILNELLLQMDPPPQEVKLLGKIARSLGLRRKRVENPPVLTIAATNLPDVLDPALLRPGRFDRKIIVDKPSAEGRREVIEYYLSKVAHDPEIPIDYMIHDTIGYTPAALRYVINEAVIHAHFEGRAAVTYDDFSAAREFHELGLKQPVPGMSQEERRRIAYHEAGHAVAGYILFPRHRVVKVTIVRHASALGMASYKPSEETYTQDRDAVLADITVSLAARAAEELFLGVQLNGVQSDLRQATQRATEMVSAYGMGGSLYSAANVGPFATDMVTRRKVERILAHQFREARRLLQANASSVHAVAAALLDEDELNEMQLRAIMEQFEIIKPEALPEPEWTDADERSALREQALVVPAPGVLEASSEAAAELPQTRPD
jgi:ATP-dependent Zn protease